MTTDARPGDTEATRSRLLAWWSLALFPVSFVSAFLVGECVPALLGHPDASAVTTPAWVVVVAFTLAVLVLAAPLVVTVVFSNRAAALGAPRARMPMLVALVVIGGFVVVNVLSGLMTLVFG
ncbi:hypothetical protein [Agromyces sp. SYSU T00194]|uniref:hypothetical protein n=1 Tax=Agromyces chitinivorans TaxID=3158560 RepID=UPI0033915C19